MVDFVTKVNEDLKRDIKKVFDYISNSFSLPKQAKEHQRSEGGSKSCPGEADNGKNNTVLIQSNHNRRNGNHKKRDS